jgi:hypothetical protein
MASQSQSATPKQPAGSQRKSNVDKNLLWRCIASHEYAFFHKDAVPAFNEVVRAYNNEMGDMDGMYIDVHGVANLLTPAYNKRNPHSIPVQFL